MMVSKRAQTRQQRQFQKKLMSLKMSLPTSNNSSELSKPNLSSSAAESVNLSSLTPEMMEALNQMSEEEVAALQTQMQNELPTSSLPSEQLLRKRRKIRTGSGGDGSDEIGSELLAPLSGKYLRQEKELKSLAGAICFGLVAAAKTSGNQALFLDAQTVAKYGGEVAHACAVLGRRYTWLHEILDKLCAGSMIAIVLSPVSAMISEIASNHGYTIPSLRLGTDNSTTERAAVL